MIAILDYDAGNVKSVEKALQFLGEEAVITDDRDTILAADRAILPGVGTFGEAMDKLKSRGLDKVIYEFTATGKPFLGICLGLQLLFDGSDESPGVQGLGLFKGKITKIPTDYVDENGAAVQQKVPQIGWNDLTINPESRLFAGITGNPYVYFVHSYFLTAENPSEVAASTYYGTEIHAAVERGNIFATQFHPEKSSEVGLKILENFVKMA